MDDNGFSGSCSAVRSFTIAGSDLVSIELDDLLPTTCNEANGYIQVAPNGGTPPYSFDWSNGATGTINEDLAAGNYTVTMTDGDGCEVIRSFTIDPSFGIVVLGEDVLDTSCGLDNGEIRITELSATIPITYTWSNGADNRPFNQNLAPGNYSLTITDSSNPNCTLIRTYTIAPSDPIEVDIDANDPTCDNNDGSITVTPSGGQEPYTYQWNIGPDASHEYELQVNVSADFEGGVGDGVYNSCGQNSGAPSAGEGLYNLFEVFF